MFLLVFVTSVAAAALGVWLVDALVTRNFEGATA